MLNNIFRKLKNLNSLIKLIYYQFKQQLIFLIFLKNKKYIYDQTKILKKSGYIHLKTIIPEKIIDDFIKNYEKDILKKKNNLSDNYAFQVHVEPEKAKVFFDYFNKNMIVDICRDYLGKIGILNCMINYQNENDCEISSMQPHHDTRGNDLKIYVWLSDYNEKSHPLYYLEGSNNDIKFFITDKHHRRKDIPKEKMTKLYGNKGDIIIFDTHGWHSHTKKNTAERAVLELTIIPINYFFKSFEKESYYF